MNDGNPFTATQAPADPAAEKKTGSHSFEIFHNTFRGLVAFLFIGLAPVFVVPQLGLVFEEFGITLPLVAQLVIQFSQLACATALIFLPLSFGIFAAIECGIFFIASGSWKTLINIVYWLALALVIGLACSGLVMPGISIISGLAANIDLLSHLLRF